MSKSKAVKQELRQSISERLEKSNAAILAEYRGLTVGELSELRVELRKINSQFSVINNRIAKKAIELESQGSEPIKDLLKGPLGIVYSYGDVAASAKVVLKFAKDHDKFKVTGGLMDGAAVSVSELDALSKLPSREVLLGQIVGSLVSPHRGILGVLNGVTRSLVQVINAIKDQKS
ncbi:MAG: 50S ribosomal protein L10 [Bdellovibrionota bacterium]